jgi:hypothetical protein
MTWHPCPTPLAEDLVHGEEWMCEECGKIWKLDVSPGTRCWESVERWERSDGRRSREDIAIFMERWPNHRFTQAIISQQGELIPENFNLPCYGCGG